MTVWGFKETRVYHIEIATYANPQDGSQPSHTAGPSPHPLKRILVSAREVHGRDGEASEGKFWFEPKMGAAPFLK